MPKFYFYGDICHPGVVIIEEPTAEEAVRRAKEGDFDEIEEEDFGGAIADFKWVDNKDGFWTEKEYEARQNGDFDNDDDE